MGFMISKMLPELSLPFGTIWSPWETACLTAIARKALGFTSPCYYLESLSVIPYQSHHKWDLRYHLLIRHRAHRQSMDSVAV